MTDTDSLLALALERCATISPHVDAIFQLKKLTHTSTYYALQFELFQLHLKVCLFERMFKFNHVGLGPGLCVVSASCMNVHIMCVPCMCRVCVFILSVCAACMLYA